MFASANTTRVIAPAYYTVAGTQPKQGAVVTRDREGPDESRGEGIWSIGDGTKAPGEWWRLETNWDHWTVITDGRRQAANKAMAGIGQDFVDLGAMEKLLATPPVLADDTVYTALIWPSGSVYQSTVRTHSAAARASVEA